jgi:ubiquinone/menaquinone biosynthesis C-methylase UbiE
LKKHSIHECELGDIFFMEWEAILGVSSLQILNRLELKVGMSVLDVGCGYGRVSIPIAKRVESNGLVVALDMRADQLRRLEQRAASEGLSNIRTLHSRIEAAPLEPNTFDYALLVGVLGEIPDRATGLRQIFAALKPSGVLSITEGIVDPHYQRQAALRQRAEAAGFQSEQLYHTWPAYTYNFLKPSRA